MMRAVKKRGKGRGGGGDFEGWVRKRTQYAYTSINAERSIIGSP